MSADVQALEEILNGEEDVEKVLDYFRGQDEKQRQKVAAACLAAYRKRKDAIHVVVAVVASSSISDLKKLGWRVRPQRPILYRVLADRRPPWIDDYVTTILDDDVFGAWWPLVRQLVRDGICSKPDHANYILGMVTGLVNRLDGDDHRTIAEKLLADPELLKDEVWRVFEHEGGGENSLANYDRFSRGNTWADSLIQLSQQGHLDRDRLIDASLDALGRDFNHYRAHWFANFHDALKPSDAEIAARASRYLHLLQSNTEPTAAWAFEVVEGLDKKQAFDDRDLVQSLRPILRSRKKGLAKSALKLLDRVAKRSADREIKSLATDVATEALLHETAEVQNAVLALLEGLGPPVESMVARLREIRELVAPSCRARLDALLPSAELEASGNTSVKQVEKRLDRKSSATATPANDIAQRLRNVDPHLVRLAGLAGFASASDGAEKLAAAKFDGTEIPRLDPTRAVRPIEDLDELIDCAARCIEEPTLIDDAERVLDGLSRLCDQRPENFERRVDPLLHRVTKLLKSKVYAFAGFGPEDDICGTVYAWAKGEVLEPISRRGFQSPMNEAMHADYKQVHRSLMGFFSRRSLQVAKRVAAREARPMLSAPTHQGGWIDPVTLVERAGYWIENRWAPDDEDLILALLRLAPDHRAQALNRVPKIEAQWLQVIRHALGGSDVTIGENAALWVAAARARAPWQDDQAVEAKHPDLGPDGGCAARYEWRESMYDGKWPNYRIDVEPKFPKAVEGKLLTVLFHAKFEPFDEPEQVARVRWLTAAWPMARESLFAVGALRFGFNIDWVEAQWANKQYLEPLIDADVPLLPMASLLLGIALSAKEPGEHRLAIDVATAAIDDGRLNHELLGAILRDLLPTKSIKIARWSKNLTEVARVSRLHAWVVSKGIEASLRTLPKPLPRDLHTLLELLIELSAEARDGIRDDKCREVLGNVSGSNKLAKAAKKLLNLKPDDAACQDNFGQVCARASEQRWQRLESWSKRLNDGERCR